MGNEKTLSIEETKELVKESGTIMAKLGEQTGRAEAFEETNKRLISAIEKALGTRDLEEAAHEISEAFTEIKAAWWLLAEAAPSEKQNAYFERGNRASEKAGEWGRRAQARNWNDGR